MRSTSFILSLLLAINCNYLYCQTTDWVVSFGGIDSDKGISIGTDSLGFIYGSGYFNNQATFGGITLTNKPLSTSGNNKENFVFKMDSSGNVLWAVAGGDLSGGCCDDRALGMHVTAGGEVFITGTFWSSYYIDSCSVTQNQWGTALNAHDNSLLAKLDTDGNCVWVIGFGADEGAGSGYNCPYPIYDADDHSYDVKVDKDGFIYVTGFFSGLSAEFDNLTITNPNWGVDCQPKGYIGKLDPAGNWLWVKEFDGIKDQRGSRDNRLAIDKFSNIYVIGGFQNTGTYGPFSLTSNGEWDAFIFKMDKDGNWIWAEGFGSDRTDRANGVAVDVCDDIYVTGEYRNPIVFSGANASNGTDTLSHKQKRDVFVAKINNQGEWKWAKRARTDGTDKPYQMSVDANKQVFLGGTAKGDLKFNDNLTVSPQIPGDTTASAWIAQLDGSTNTGDWVWAKQAGCDTDDDDRTNDICVDGFGNVYAIGFFEDLANFDGTILDATGRSKDIFVWKMSMTPGSFTISNTYDTVYTEEMVYNPADTGIFITSTYTVDGCDTNFVDSVLYNKLGVLIDFNINNPGSATITIDGVLRNMPYTQSYWAGDTIFLSAIIQPNWLFNKWSTYFNSILPSSTYLNSYFIASASDSCVLQTYPKPPLTAFISGNDTICNNQKEISEIKISFNSGTEPFTFTYSIDGVTQTSITTDLNPYIIYTNQSGVYSLESFSDALETGSISGSALIVVNDAPEAIFSSSSDTLSILYPTIQLTDQSIGYITSWAWDFGDNSPIESIPNPIHNYNDEYGIYQISLIVEDNNGCTDTSIRQVWVTDEYWMYIPNSFSPDYDGVNDLFCIYYNGVRTETFLFNIYDRFSSLVYSTDNINDLECLLNTNGWNGKHQKDGTPLPNGTYVYEIYLQDFEGWKHKEYGQIFIVR